MKKWTVLITLALATLIIVIDTTIMNVSISALVEDLGTSVAGIQLAISLFALVMASTMMIGAKLGDIFGKKKIFILGVAIFGTGTFIASISQNLTTLLIGWSLIEGLGSALMLPNIQTILRASYDEKDRVFGYGILGAVAAIGAALGPLVGGFLTSFYSWRWAFRLEVAIVIIVLILARNIKKDEILKNAPKLDFLNIFYWVVALVGIVLTVLLAQSYGLIIATQNLVIGGNEINLFGLSIAFYVLVIGITFLMLFAKRNQFLSGIGRALYNPNIFKFDGYIGAEIARFVNMMLVAGFLFTFPLFLQMSFEYSAMETGVLLMPFSASILVAALSGSKLTSKFSAKQILIIGGILSTLGLVLLAPAVELSNGSYWYLIVTVVIGLGVGLIASQLVNKVFSMVDNGYQADAAGLNGTFEQLGNSLGVAILGGILVSVLTTNLISNISTNELLTAEESRAVVSELNGNVQILSDSTVSNYLEIVENEDKRNSLLSDYQVSRSTAFTAVSFSLAAISLIGTIAISRIPEKD